MARGAWPVQTLQGDASYQSLSLAVHHQPPGLWIFGIRVHVRGGTIFVITFVICISRLLQAGDTFKRTECISVSLLTAVLLLRMCTPEAAELKLVSKPLSHELQRVQWLRYYTKAQRISRIVLVLLVHVSSLY